MDAVVVVGLGNPGAEYADNRHNLGAMVIDELATRAGVSLKRHKARARAADARLGVGEGGRPGGRAILAVPSSYMNLSGGPVAALLSYYSLAPSALIVIHDELDLPLGQVRIKVGGGEGGHNGLRSISGALGTKDYIRIRAGIGRPPGRQDAADYVLRGFSTEQRRELPLLLGEAADAAELVVNQGVTAAQQIVHAPR